MSHESTSPTSIPSVVTADTVYADQVAGSTHGTWATPVVLRGRTTADNTWLMWLVSGICNRVVAREDTVALYDQHNGDVAFDQLAGFCSQIGLPFRDVVEVVAMAFRNKRDFGSTTTFLFSQPANHEAIRERTRTHVAAILRGSADFIDSHPDWLLTSRWPELSNDVARLFDLMKHSATARLAAEDGGLERGRSKAAPSSRRKTKRKRKPPPSAVLVGEILYRLWCDEERPSMMARELYDDGYYETPSSALRQIPKWQARARTLMTPL